MNCGRKGAHRPDGSDVEDDSLALPDHLFVDRLGNGKQTVNIRVNHFIPRAVRGGGEVVAAIDGGVVDENIDTAPLFDELAREFLHAHAVDHGHFRVERLTAVGFDLLTHFGGEVITRVVAKRHIGAFTRKNLANRRTYTARSTGYERTFS